MATTSEQLRLANLLYSNGIASYLDVLDAQRTLFSSRQALLTTHFDKHINDVMLYAALGGGAVDVNGPEGFKRTVFMDYAAKDNPVARETAAIKQVTNNDAVNSDALFSGIDVGEVKVSEK